MTILYVGQTEAESTSGHRVQAFRRLGHQLLCVDPGRFVPNLSILHSFNVRTGFRLVVKGVERKLRKTLANQAWDLVWIDCGPELGPSFYQWLRRRGRPIVNYNLDNPFVSRDHRKWDQYKKSLPLHDLTLLPRQESVEQAARHGARRAILVPRTYDPVAHHPSRAGSIQPRSGKVVFVGTWMEERGPFFKKLIELGVPLKIFGERWNKDPHWKFLAGAWGGAVYGEDYVRVIYEARIALGLVSLGNRDEDTTRSVEIPYIGGAAFCAQKTQNHMKMFRENEEALFWTSPQECAECIKNLLKDHQTCSTLARKARRRIIDLKLSNDEVLGGVLEMVETLKHTCV